MFRSLIAHALNRPRHHPLKRTNEELQCEIAEHKQLEAELREAKDATEDVLLKERVLAASIVDSSGDAIIGKTLDGTITSWNQGAESIFGYPAKEMIGQSVFTLIPPERHNEVAEVLFTLLRGEPVRNFEAQRIRKDGIRIDVSITAVPIRNREGRMIGISKVARDITESRRLRIYGEMAREVLQILNKHDHPRNSIQFTLAALKSRTGFDAVGIRLQDGDDYPYYVQDGFSENFLLTENSLAERGADGQVCRDMNGKSRLECTCGLVISGRTGSGNPLFTPWGSFWTSDSHALLDIPAEEDPRLHPRNRCIHQGYASVALIPIRNEDRIVGLIQFNDRRKGCFTLDTVEYLEGIASHIGEALMRKQAELELEDHRIHLEELVISRTSELVAANAEAKKANTDKSRFLAAASHDLRQPLLALSLYVSLLKTGNSSANGNLPVKIKECVASLNEMLTDLLDISKLDAGVLKPRPTDFDVDDLLTTLISVHSAEADLKGLNLYVRCAGAVARTDPHLLQRILGNLVANAVRYTDKGGILVACRRHQGKLWVEVWDTGIGIPEDKTGIIFEEFRQLGDDARSRGSGLGLSIVAKTAALLGLQIRVRSRPGRGSMFAVELPPGRSSNLQQLPITRPIARPLRIGVVEDNAMVLEALVLALDGSGHEVVAARNGRAFLERLEQRAPDIVISDYRLGAGETGFDVIAAAKDQFGNDLPAAIVTGDTDPALVRIMADRGIAMFYKPLDIETLLRCIGELTERRLS